MLLTQSTTPIIGQIAVLLGYIMDMIFKGLSNFGIQNLGLCIIIFTIIVRIILLPMTYKQQKFSKMSQAMQPEIQKIQKKYKGRKDQASVQKQNEEIQAVYQKYGVSMSSGCLQLVIQMPIFFALYQVIRRIPAYIPEVKAEYMAIVKAIDIKNPETISMIKKIGKGLPNAYSGIDKLTKSSPANTVIDVLNYFDQIRWEKLADAIPNAAGAIVEHSKNIMHMNTFIPGINVMEVPGWRFSIYIIIPILAGLFQYLAAKTMQTPQEGDQANMTRSMTMMMPLMSFFICITTPAGLGIYWATSACFQLIQQLVINKILDKKDLNEMIAKNMEKAAEKKAKGKKSITEKIMEKTSGAKEASEAPTQRKSISSMGKMKTMSAPKVKGAVEKGFRNEEYYDVIADIDHSRLGSVSRNAYAVSEYDKKHGNTGKGGKQ